MNMINAAWSLGIGSVFVGLWPYISTPGPGRASIPENFKLLYAVAFGYPSGPYLPRPEDGRRHLYPLKSGKTTNGEPYDSQRSLI